MTKAEKIKALNEYLTELNNKDIGFDFVLKQDETDEDLYYLYDRNECYYYDYAYDSYVMMCECADEFGFEKPTSYDDSIHDRLEQIVGDVVEWYDNVMMMFRVE